MHRQFWRVGVSVSLSILAVCLIAPSKEKQPKSYSEKGTIVSTKTSEEVETHPVRTDNSGRIRGGGSTTYYMPVYRIETDTKIYELQARTEKREFAVGNTVQFRIEKQWAYVQQGDKEKKLRVVTVELKPNAKSSDNH